MTDIQMCNAYVYWVRRGWAFNGTAGGEEVLAVMPDYFLPRSTKHCETLQVALAYADGVEKGMETERLTKI